MNTCPPHAGAAATCFVAGHAFVEARLSEIGGLRDRPVPEAAPALPPRFLRHCDEQTVVGVRAVLEAIARQPEPRQSFDRFGVIGSSCAAGRIAAAQTLAQLATAGTTAVSPHIVPQCSLHALASAVSVAFGMHGPNIGACGGPHAVSEGLFAAFSLLQAHGDSRSSCDGIWLVVSEWAEEPALDAAGKPLNDPLCRALAMALTRDADATATLTLHFNRAIDDGRHAGDVSAADALVSFAGALAMCGEGGVLESWSHVCPWGAEVRVVAGRAAVVTRREAA
jgi:hypothetical protein